MIKVALEIEQGESGSTTIKSPDFPNLIIFGVNMVDACGELGRYLLENMPERE